MTVPRLLTTQEDIGNSLAQLAEGVAGVVAPNRKFNQEIKALFIQKPELMQKFVDIEKSNPGTLKAFGFNDAATDLLSRMQESIPGLVTRETQPRVQEALKDPSSRISQTATTQAAVGATPGSIAGDTLNEVLGKGFTQLLEEAPPEQRQQLLLDQFTKTTAGERARDRQTEQTVDQAFTPEEIEGRVLSVDAREFLDGDLDASVASRLLITPGAAEGFKLAVEGELTRRNQGIQLELQKMRGSIDLQQSRIAASSRGQGPTLDPDTVLREARKSFVESGSAGSINAWALVLTDPRVEERMTQLGNKAIEPESQLDLDLLDIFNSIEKKRRLAFNTELSKLRTDFGKVLTPAKENVNSPEVETNLQQLNEILERMQTITGGPLLEAFRDAPLNPFVRNKIKFRVVETGEEVSETKVRRLMQSPEGTAQEKASLSISDLTPAEREGVAALQAGTASLEDLEASVGSADFKRRVRIVFEKQQKGAR